MDRLGDFGEEVERCNCDVQFPSYDDKRILRAEEVLPEPALSLRAGVLLEDRGASDSSFWWGVISACNVVCTF